MDGNICSASSQDELSTSSPTYGRPKIDKINDSLYLLHDIEGTPKVDIIFFHGLQEESGNHEAFWKSWMTLCKSDCKPNDPHATEAAEESVCWPIEWLGQELDGARIYSLAYDASAKKTNKYGKLDMFNIVENQITGLLDLHQGHNVGQACPVILVGHSIGGVVIKQLLLAAQCKADMFRRTEGGESEGKKPIETFLRNVKGVFFYSTPQSGTKLTKFIDKALKHQGSMAAPIMGFFGILSKKSARLNDRFQSWRHPYGETSIKTYTVGEGLKTKTWGFNKMVAKEGSCRRDTDGYYKAEAADHFTVIRPLGRSDSIYLHLRKFVADNSRVEILKGNSIAQDLT